MKKLNKIIYVIIALLFVSVCLCAYGCTIINAMSKETNNEYYNSLTAEEKTEYDSKLKDLKESRYYKSLSMKEKSSLLDKFIESEKTLKLLESDPIDKSPEEIQQKIDELTESGATAEEIKAAEQEKNYWTAIKTIKDATTANFVFNFVNPEIKIRKINGIYNYHLGAYFNADFVKEEVIDGKTYYSTVNLFCDTSGIVRGRETFEEIMSVISSAGSIDVDITCVNYNAESHKQYYEEFVRQNAPALKIWEERGYTFKIIVSWENAELGNKPEYIIEGEKEDESKRFMVCYDTRFSDYSCEVMPKICPEFWAQLAIENAKNNSK